MSATGFTVGMKLIEPPLLARLGEGRGAGIVPDVGPVTPMLAEFHVVAVATARNLEHARVSLDVVVLSGALAATSRSGVPIFVLEWRGFWRARQDETGHVYVVVCAV